MCVVLSPCLCACVTYRMCPCAVWGPHCGFLFLPTIFLCPPSLPPTLSKLPYTPFSLSLPVRKKWTIWPLVAAITFSLMNSLPLRLSFHILTGLFSLPAPLFSLEMITLWLTSSARGQGGSQASTGSHTYTYMYYIYVHTAAQSVSSMFGSSHMSLYSHSSLK